MVNVATYLQALAEREPHRAAVIYPESRDGRGRVAYTHLTFAQLHQESDALAHGLQSIGIERGVRTVLMVPPSLDFFTLTFALFKIGAVPILIDPGMGIRNLGRCLGEAKPTTFIGIPKAHLARRILRWSRATLRITVTTGSRWLGGKFRARDLLQQSIDKGPFPQVASSADEMAAILFTSGSTGIAKGVVYTHGIFAAQIAILKDLYGIQPGEIDLATFPLFALFAPALGMTAIVPEMDPTKPALVDPRKIIEAIDNFGVTNLFGSPALINRVGRYGLENNIQFPSLRRVISAGAPVPAAVIERFCKMLPSGVQLFTPYGATEALPVASIGSATILAETRFATERGAGVCVGDPVPGISVRIIPIQDNALATMTETLALPIGQVGEIVVSGPVVTASYWNRPAATDLAKLHEADGTLWHRMGDLGLRDAAGRIWFWGRKSHRVETPDGTLFTIPCEAVFNVHPAVYRTALVGVPFGGRNWPVICVELESGGDERDWQQIEGELQKIAAIHPHTQAIGTFLRHPRFPVDIRHNAKIFREKLARWAARILRKQGWNPQ